MSRVTVRTPILKFSSGTFASRPDTVAGEEPLEIRMAGRPLSVTMRTPGHDIELVHGFLHAEGLISGRSDIAVIRYCDGVDEQGQNTYNVLDVTLAGPPRTIDEIAAVTRPFITSSACGVCGKASIDALNLRRRHATPTGPMLPPEMIMELPDRLRSLQKTFRVTGGIHAAALVRPDGTLYHLREDVGRHNAVDKVIGAALMADELPAAGSALLTSSRASFELVQKALLAGIGMLIAVSAPSSLAVELGEDAGLTLIGFTRSTGFNIYSGAHRVVGARESDGDGDGEGAGDGAGDADGE